MARVQTMARPAARSMAVSAAMVKELRQASGAPIMECKAALSAEDVAGDFDKAMDWLRKKGVAAAGKRAGRGASEGLVAVRITPDQSRAVVVELNSETDFVARNETFREFIGNVADLTLAQADAAADQPVTDILEAVSAADMEGTPVADSVVALVAKIRENIVLRGATAVAVPAGKGIVATYVHNQADPNVGSIASLVALSTPEGAPAAGSEQDAALQQLGKLIAMHAAAAKPLAVRKEDMPSEAVEREQRVLREQALESGKPAEVVDKMIGGRMEKFFRENCLLDQVCMVTEGKETVGQLVAAAASEVGGPVTVAACKVVVVGDAAGDEGEEQQDA